MRTLLIVIAVITLTAGCSLYNETQITIVGGADASTTHSHSGSGSDVPYDGGIYNEDAGYSQDAYYGGDDGGYYYPDAGCYCPFGCGSADGGAGSAICIDVAR